MNIKKLKPRTGKKSHYKQGYFNVKNSKKYAGDPKCIYRSGLEFKFMTWCELKKPVVEWQSEPLFITYICPITGKERKYWIDFIVKLESGETWFVEVKPYKEVVEAQRFAKMRLNEDQNGRIPKTYHTAAKNSAKWKTTKSLCNKKGYRFVIVTERFFKGK